MTPHLIVSSAKISGYSKKNPEFRKLHRTKSAFLLNQEPIKIRERERERLYRLKGTWETWQSYRIFGHYLDPDFKQSDRKVYLWDNHGILSTNWILRNNFQSVAFTMALL